jgi:hypothetical protein
MSDCAYKGGLTEGSGCHNAGRWVGPDGSGDYCSMHFVSLFGHGERLVRSDRYEVPANAPAPPKAEKDDPNLVKDAR